MSDNSDFRIYKYPLAVAGTQRVSMPRGAKLLHVAPQAGHAVCLWALVDTLSPTCKRTIAIVGTGHPIDNDVLHTPHVGTFLLNGGTLVFHVFDCGESQQ